MMNADLKATIEYYRLAVIQVKKFTSGDLGKWRYKRAIRKAGKTESAAKALRIVDRPATLRKHAPDRAERIEEIEQRLTDELEWLREPSTPRSAIEPALEQMRAWATELTNILDEIEIRNQ